MPSTNITQEQRQRLYAKPDEVIDRVKSQRTVDEMVAALRDLGFDLLLMVMQTVVAGRGDLVTRPASPEPRSPLGCPA